MHSLATKPLSGVIHNRMGGNLACHQTGGEKLTPKWQENMAVYSAPPPPHPPLYSRSGYNPDNTSLGQVFIQLMFLCKILEIEMRGGGVVGGGRKATQLRATFIGELSPNFTC